MQPRGRLTAPARETRAVWLHTQLFSANRVLCRCQKILMSVLKQPDQFRRDSPEALNALHDLAIAFNGTRQYAREQAMWEKLHRRRLQKLVPDHPETISSMQNLGYVYYRQGKLAEAERLQRQGLAIELACSARIIQRICTRWEISRILSSTRAARGKRSRSNAKHSQAAGAFSA